ncbi:MAG: hypothetical protein K2X38_23630 [Gemmataceae bacterium]|nr:hypothetical protein [Gemmataceae bacterium]
MNGFILPQAEPELRRTDRHGTITLLPRQPSIPSTGLPLFDYSPGAAAV